jgi:hypothetical protein
MKTFARTWAFLTVGGFCLVASIAQLCAAFASLEEGSPIRALGFAFGVCVTVGFGMALTNYELENRT